MLSWLKQTSTIGRFLAGLSLFFVLAIGPAGCGASQIQAIAAESVATAVCDTVCQAQDLFDVGICEKVCVEVANTSRKVLKDPSLDGIFDIACDVACAKQTSVDSGVCLDVCNFLANKGESMLKNKV